MKRIFQIVILVTVAVTSHYTAWSQCTQSVNYTGWTHYGDNSASWNYTATQASSTVNTNYPTFYVGPDTFINVMFSGDIMVNTSFDDDYIGFVMGYQGPYTLFAPWDMDFVLFDWKQSYQNYLGWIANAGQSLNLVDGSYQMTNASVFPGFWNHNNGPSWQVLASNFGNLNGWTDFVTYSFDIVYTPTNIKVFIDDSLYFDVNGCFKPGRIGFYNYSQESAVYTNFTYELYMDFQIETENVCLSDTANFILYDTSCATGNSLTNINSFYWDLGDGTITNDTNPSHIYQTADTFLVHLVATDINGCTDSSSKEIYIHAPPTADLFAADVCLDDATNFIDTTQLSMGTITDWEWDFGDGVGSSTNQNPTYTYQNSGTYPVQLIVTTNAACVDTVVENVTVLPNPSIDFNIDHACELDTVTLTQDVDPAGAPISNYFWDINNDGTQEYTGPTAQHVFTSEGSFPVELIAINANGCRDSAVINALAHPIPEVDLSGPGVCFNETTQFIDQTVMPYTSAIFWEWDFGDGNQTSYDLANAPSQGPQHLYASPGTKTINLTVTSDSGCVGTLEKDIEVYHLPEANFFADTVCDDDVSTFTSASTTQSGFISVFHWDFGDGGTSSSAVAQHDYTQSGPFSVMHAVESNFGCVDTIVKPIAVFPVPVAGFGWNNNVCEGEELVFVDQSTIPQVSSGGDAIVGWRWVFNESDTQYVQHPSYTGTSHGPVNVSLTAISNYGCETTVSNTATIFPTPNADFSVFEACADDTTWFNNRSSVAWGLIDGASWIFRSGHTSNQLNPGHVYTAPGNYDVTMTVRSANGCADSVIKQITIPETPQADFSLDPFVGCSPFRLEISDASNVMEGELSYDWFVNDSLVAQGQDPVIDVINDTLIPLGFKVSLKVTSDKGCPNVLDLNNAITVLPSPIAGFAFDEPGANPFQEAVDFRNTSKYGVRWFWDLGDGNTTDAFAPNHLYEQSGDFLIKQVLWNEYNCPDSLIRKITIEPWTSLYIPSAFTPNNDGVNDIWFVKGVNEDKGFEISIFNRWGELMVESEGMDFQWDGSMLNSNEIAPNGTYVYIIYFTRSDDREETIRGTFNLLK